MRPELRRWFERRTSSFSDWPLAELRERKGATTVSVVLPARDEQATVGTIVRTVRRELMGARGLVDEIVVVDSGSGDATREVAADAGAVVVAAADVLPQLGTGTGKGEALWKSLAVTYGDLLVFLDADLREFSSSFVRGLLGPLLSDPTVAFVKAAYDRPFAGGDATWPTEGGRVTELVARPLLNLHWPDLAGFLQPLAGEYAGRRAVLERVSFASGYAVELALLVDLLHLVGLDAMAQVDLGRRIHRNRPTAELGVMASAIWQVALDRLGGPDVASRQHTQFARSGAGFAATTCEVTVTSRPPMAMVPEYAALRARAS